MKNLLLTTTATVAIGVLSTAASAAECSRNFSTIDVNGDGMISKTEAAVAVVDEFKRLDEDGSGSVSKSEWKNCLATQSADSDSKELFALGDEFADADLDNDGNLTVEEAAKSAKKSYAADGSQASQEEQARNFGAQFSMIDENGDWSISKSEWENRNQADTNASFRRLDADGDGEVSQSEFHDARSKTEDEQSASTSVWYYFIY